MKTVIGFVCVAAIGLAMSEQALSSGRQAARTDAFGGSSRLVARFLASATPPLVSYQATRRLSASTKGGRMTAAIDVRTSLDSNGRFQYEVTKEQGSSLIRRHVLLAALEEERRMREEKDTEADLVPANYEFRVDEGGGDFLKIHLQPRRRSSRLIEGAVFTTRDGLDIVRVEGRLSEPPSFWTRRVEITRRYTRIAGVRVPVEMTSRADVRIVGESTFSMVYEYVRVNGRSVAPAESGWTTR
jgi:hypothetical protein